MASKKKNQKKGGAAKEQAKKAQVHQVDSDVEIDSVEVRDAEVDNIMEMDKNQILEQSYEEDEDQARKLKEMEKDDQFDPYYDSIDQNDQDQDQDYDDDGDGQSPINLPRHSREDLLAEHGLDSLGSEDEDDLFHEKIYSICAAGKKTQVNSLELYGFSYWNLTALLFLVYLIWCLVPDEIIHSWGIQYIPNKYYALALPTWLGVTLWMVISGYVSFSQMHVHPKDSYLSMQDYATVLMEPKTDSQLMEKMNRSGGQTEKDTSGVLSPLKGIKKAQSSIFQMSQQSFTQKKGGQFAGINSRKSPTKETEEKDYYEIHYYKEIPEIQELPITLVCNVLYKSKEQIASAFGRMGGKRHIPDIQILKS